MNKKQMLAEITNFKKRIELLEQREHEYLCAAGTFGTQLNVLRQKQCEIADRYEKIIEQNRDILNSHDVLRKQFAKLNSAQDAYVTWLKNLGGRLNEIEKDKF